METLIPPGKHFAAHRQNESQSSRSRLSSKIGLGCLDVRFAEIEPPEKVVERVEKALAHVAPERLTLNPDCGFAPGKDHEIPLEEAYAKLKNLPQAARQLRGEYGSPC